MNTSSGCQVPMTRMSRDAGSVSKPQPSCSPNPAPVRVIAVLCPSFHRTSDDGGGTDERNGTESVMILEFTLSEFEQGPLFLIPGVQDEILRVGAPANLNGAVIDCTYGVTSLFSIRCQETIRHPTLRSADERKLRVDITSQGV